MPEQPCIACAGKGTRWARGRTGESHMIKRKCPYCKGTGRAKETGKGQDNG